MSFDSGKVAQLEEAAHKDKLRKQMHHDLCVLSVGKTGGGDLREVASNAMTLYKELWHQVMKEIP